VLLKCVAMGDRLLVHAMVADEEEDDEGTSGTLVRPMHISHYKGEWLLPQWVARVDLVHVCRPT
jgi:hypothetical protein